jgi:hypothetical protein
MSTILLMMNDKTKLGEITKILTVDDHKVIVAEKGLSIRGFVNDNPDTVMIDAVYGAAMIEETKKGLPNKPIICVLPSYDARLALEMMKAGAFDCIYPPFRKSGVIPVVEHAVGKSGPPKAGAGPKPITWKTHKKFFYAGGVVLACLLLAAVLFKPAKPMKFDLPYNDPTAIVCDAGEMWISNWYTQSIYRYKATEDGLELKKSFYFSDFGPTALAKYDNYIWSLGNDLTLRQHMLNDNLDVVRTYKLTGHTPTGMVFINNNLWICDSAAKKFFQFIISNGLVLVNTYETGLQSPVGICWDGSSIWTVDAATNKLYRFRQKMDTLELVQIYRLSKTATGSISGLCVVGKTAIFIYTDTPSYVIKRRLSELKTEI